MPSDKSLLEMRRAFRPLGTLGLAESAALLAAEVADRLVAEAVTEERQRILDAVNQHQAERGGMWAPLSPSEVRAIVNGTDQR